MGLKHTIMWKGKACKVIQVEPKNTVKIRICIHVVGWIMAPQNVYILVPDISENVTLHARGGFVDVLKLRILRLKDYAVWLVWAQCNYKGPYKKETIVRAGERCV